MRSARRPTLTAPTRSALLAAVVVLATAHCSNDAFSVVTPAATDAATSSDADVPARDGGLTADAGVPADAPPDAPYDPIAVRVGSRCPASALFCDDFDAPSAADKIFVPPWDEQLAAATSTTFLARGTVATTTPAALHLAMQDVGSPTVPNYLSKQIAVGTAPFYVGFDVAVTAAPSVVSLAVASVVTNARFLSLIVTGSSTMSIYDAAADGHDNTGFAFGAFKAGGFVHVTWRIDVVAGKTTVWIDGVMLGDVLLPARVADGGAPGTKLLLGAVASADGSGGVVVDFDNVSVTK